MRQCYLHGEEHISTHLAHAARYFSAAPKTKIPTNSGIWDNCSTYFHRCTRLFARIQATWPAWRVLLFCHIRIPGTTRRDWHSYCINEPQRTASPGHSPTSIREQISSNCKAGPPFRWLLKGPLLAGAFTADWALSQDSTPKAVFHRVPPATKRDGNFICLFAQLVAQ